MATENINVDERDRFHGAAPVRKEPELGGIVSGKEGQRGFASGCFRDAAQGVVVYGQHQPAGSVQEQAVTVCAGRQRAALVAEKREADDFERNRGFGGESGREPALFLSSRVPHAGVES